MILLIIASLGLKCPEAPILLIRIQTFKLFGLF